MMSKSLNEKIECYYTREARVALAELERVGFEKDLAVAVLEQIWTEDAIYDIGDSDYGTEAPWMSNE